MLIGENPAEDDPDLPGDDDPDERRRLQCRQQKHQEQGQQGRQPEDALLGLVVAGEGPDRDFVPFGLVGVDSVLGHAYLHGRSRVGRTYGGDLVCTGAR